MRRTKGMLLLAAVPCALCGLNRAARAQADLSPVVVIATRVAESSFDVPASVDRVSQEEIKNGQVQINISESLMTVPGVSAESRQNYAQDLQLSVRGFGARSSFGVRGVRLYSDGIPGTMPDGQGQFSQFDLGSADRMEVLRGPFSALYGNSSGGVISIFTEDAPPGYYLDGTAHYGTFNTERYALKTMGNDGNLNYVIDAAHFQTDGYRFHSQAERDNFNSKLRIPLSADSTLTVIANVVETPFVQDPLGLTSAQLAMNREQAGTGAIAYNTRKSLDQEQLGAIYEDKLSAADTLSTTLYTGHRATTQFQAIPQATQEKEPLYPGGVIALDRAYWGVDTHVSDVREVGGTALQTVGGIAYDDLEEARQGFLNYVGDQLGVPGAIRRNEANHVYDAAEYLQAQWDPDALFRVTAGVRNNLVEVSSNDHLPGTTVPHSSVRYTAVSPVAGALFHATPSLNLYASYGKGFETPTLHDLAYRSTDGSLPGLNIGLKPARSDNFEVGIKAGKGSDPGRSRRVLYRAARRACRAAELQRPYGRAEHRRDGAARGGIRARRGRGRRPVGPRRLYLHPRGRGAGVRHLRGHAVSTGHRVGRELSARGAEERALRRPHLEVRAARVLDDDRGAGPRAHLRRRPEYRGGSRLLGDQLARRSRAAHAPMGIQRVCPT